MVGHVFGEMHRNTRLGLDAEGDLTKIFGLRDPAAVPARGFDHMINAAREAKAARKRSVTLNNAVICRIVGGLTKDLSTKCYRLARVVPVDCSGGLISRHLRGD